MAHAYPIYVNVTSCIYNSDKSYGIKRDGKQSIKVGSSIHNSHTLAEVLITKRTNDEGNIVFRYSLDGVILKEAVFKPKSKKDWDVAGELIEIKSFLPVPAH